MHNIFFFCAVIGSVLIVLQFVATFIGVGGSDLDSPDATDLDLGENIGSDVSIDAQGSDGGFDFLKALSFRTLTAGVAFWGFGGLISESLDLSPASTLGVALACGIAAIVVVYYLLRTLASFNYNGAIRADSAVNSVGSAYLRIPARRGGVGKVMIAQQERTMEYEAITDEENDLPAGTPIVVTALVSSSQVLVARISENTNLEKMQKINAISKE